MSGDRPDHHGMDAGAAPAATSPLDRGHRRRAVAPPRAAARLAGRRCSCSGRCSSARSRSCTTRRPRSTPVRRADRVAHPALRRRRRLPRRDPPGAVRAVARSGPGGDLVARRSHARRSRRRINHGHGRRSHGRPDLAAGHAPAASPSSRSPVSPRWCPAASSSRAARSAEPNLSGARRRRRARRRPARLSGRRRCAVGDVRDALWSAVTYAAAIAIGAAALRAMEIPRLVGPALLTLAFYLWDALHGTAPAPPARPPLDRADRACSPGSGSWSSPGTCCCGPERRRASAGV